MRIKLEEYKKIRKELWSLRDLNKFRYPRGMLFTILVQKKVDFIKREYPKVIERLNEIEKFWKVNKVVPKWVRLTPVMRVRVLMKSLGFTNSEILKALKNPKNVEDSELIPLIEKAIATDYIYSPLAVKHQFARGKLGENIIRKWLEERDVEFKDENEMKKSSKKTPDFYIESGIEINGKDVRWIESKALFGDLKTHWIYSKKQYLKYYDLFGNGVVIYWFGCLDSVDGEILDENNFKSTMKNALLDMRIYMTDSIEKLHKLVKNLGVSCVVNFTEHDLGEKERSFNFESVSKAAEKIIECYENGRVLAFFDSIKDSRVRGVRGLLKNMGFDVIIV